MNKYTKPFIALITVLSFLLDSVSAQAGMLRPLAYTQRRAATPLDIIGKAGDKQTTDGEGSVDDEAARAPAHKTTRHSGAGDFSRARDLVATVDLSSATPGEYAQRIRETFVVCREAFMTQIGAAQQEGLPARLVFIPTTGQKIGVTLSEDIPGFTQAHVPETANAIASLISANGDMFAEILNDTLVLVGFSSPVRCGGTLDAAFYLTPFGTSGIRDIKNLFRKDRDSGRLLLKTQGISQFKRRLKQFRVVAPLFITDDRSKPAALATLEAGLALDPSLIISHDAYQRRMQAHLDARRQERELEQAISDEQDQAKQRAHQAQIDAAFEKVRADIERTRDELLGRIASYRDYLPASPRGEVEEQIRRTLDPAVMKQSLHLVAAEPGREVSSVGKDVMSMVQTLRGRYTLAIEKLMGEPFPKRDDTQVVAGTAPEDDELSLAVQALTRNHPVLFACQDFWPRQRELYPAAWKLVSSLKSGVLIGGSDGERATVGRVILNNHYSPDLRDILSIDAVRAAGWTPARLAKFLSLLGRARERIQERYPELPWFDRVFFFYLYKNSGSTDAVLTGASADGLHRALGINIGSYFFEPGLDDEAFIERLVYLYGNTLPLCEPSLAEPLTRDDSATIDLAVGALREQNPGQAVVNRGSTIVTVWRQVTADLMHRQQSATKDLDTVLFCAAYLTPWVDGIVGGIFQTGDLDYYQLGEYAPFMTGVVTPNMLLERHWRTEGTVTAGEYTGGLQRSFVQGQLPPRTSALTVSLDALDAFAMRKMVGFALLQRLMKPTGSLVSFLRDDRGLNKWEKIMQTFTINLPIYNDVSAQTSLLMLDEVRRQPDMIEGVVRRISDSTRVPISKVRKAISDPDGVIDLSYTLYLYKIFALSCLHAVCRTQGAQGPLAEAEKDLADTCVTFKDLLGVTHDVCGQRLAAAMTETCELDLTDLAHHVGDDYDAVVGTMEFGHLRQGAPSPALEKPAPGPAPVINTAGALCGLTSTGIQDIPFVVDVSANGADEVDAMNSAFVKRQVEAKNLLGVGTPGEHIPTRLVFIPWHNSHDLSDFGLTGITWSGGQRDQLRVLLAEHETVIVRISSAAVAVIFTDPVEYGGHVIPVLYLVSAELGGFNALFWRLFESDAPGARLKSDASSRAQFIAYDKMVPARIAVAADTPQLEGFLGLCDVHPASDANLIGQDTYDQRMRARYRKFEEWREYQRKKREEEAKAYQESIEAAFKTAEAEVVELRTYVDNELRTWRQYLPQASCGELEAEYQRVLTNEQVYKACGLTTTDVASVSTEVPARVRKYLRERREAFVAHLELLKDRKVPSAEMAPAVTALEREFDELMAFSDFWEHAQADAEAAIDGVDIVSRFMKGPGMDRSSAPEVTKFMKKHKELSPALADMLPQETLQQAGWTPARIRGLLLRLRDLKAEVRQKIPNAPWPDKVVFYNDPERRQKAVTVPSNEPAGSRTALCLNLSRMFARPAEPAQTFRAKFLALYGINFQVMDSSYGQHLPAFMREDLTELAGLERMMSPAQYRSYNPGVGQFVTLETMLRRIFCTNAWHFAIKGSFKEEPLDKQLGLPYMVSRFAVGSASLFVNAWEGALMRHQSFEPLALSSCPLFNIPPAVHADPNDMETPLKFMALTPVEIAICLRFMKEFGYEPSEALEFIYDETKKTDGEGRLVSGVSGIFDADQHNLTLLTSAPASALSRVESALSAAQIEGVSRADITAYLNSHGTADPERRITRFFRGEQAWNIQLSILLSEVIRHAICEATGNATELAEVAQREERVLANIERMIRFQRDVHGENLPDPLRYFHQVDWRTRAGQLRADYARILRELQFRRALPSPEAAVHIEVQSEGAADTHRRELRLVVESFEPEMAQLRERLLDNIRPYERYLSPARYTAVVREITDELTPARFAEYFGIPEAPPGLATDRLRELVAAHLGGMEREYAAYIEQVIAQPLSDKELQDAVAYLESDFGELVTFSDFWTGTEAIGEQAIDLRGAAAEFNHTPLPAEAMRKGSLVRQRFREQIYLGVRQFERSPALADVLSYKRVRGKGWSPAQVSRLLSQLRLIQGDARRLMPDFPGFTRIVLSADEASPLPVYVIAAKGEHPEAALCLNLNRHIGNDMGLQVIRDYLWQYYGTAILLAEPQYQRSVLERLSTGTPPLEIDAELAAAYQPATRPEVSLQDMLARVFILHSLESCVQTPAQLQENPDMLAFGLIDYGIPTATILQRCWQNGRVQGKWIGPLQLASPAHTFSGTPSENAIDEIGRMAGWFFVATAGAKVAHTLSGEWPRSALIEDDPAKPGSYRLTDAIPQIYSSIFSNQADGPLTMLYRRAGQGDYGEAAVLEVASQIGLSADETTACVRELSRGPQHLPMYVAFNKVLSDQQRGEEAATKFARAVSWNIWVSHLLVLSFRRALLEAMGDSEGAERIRVETQTYIGEMHAMIRNQQLVCGDRLPPYVAQLHAIDLDALAESLYRDYLHILRDLPVGTAGSTETAPPEPKPDTPVSIVVSGGLCGLFSTGVQDLPIAVQVPAGSDIDTVMPPLIPSLGADLNHLVSRSGTVPTRLVFIPWGPGAIDLSIFDLSKLLWNVTGPELLQDILLREAQRGMRIVRVSEGVIALLFPHPVEYGGRLAATIYLTSRSLTGKFSEGVLENFAQGTAGATFRVTERTLRQLGSLAEIASITVAPTENQIPTVFKFYDSAAPSGGELIGQNRYDEIMNARQTEFDDWAEYQARKARRAQAEYRQQINTAYEALAGEIDACRTELTDEAQAWQPYLGGQLYGEMTAERNGDLSDDRVRRECGLDLPGVAPINEEVPRRVRAYLVSIRQKYTKRIEKLISQPLTDRQEVDRAVRAFEQEFTDIGLDPLTGFSGQRTALAHAFFGKASSLMHDPAADAVQERFRGMERELPGVITRYQLSPALDDVIRAAQAAPAGWTAARIRRFLIQLRKAQGLIAERLPGLPRFSRVVVYFGGYQSDIPFCAAPMASGGRVESALGINLASWGCDPRAPEIFLLNYCLFAYGEMLNTFSSGTAARICDSFNEAAAKIPVERPIPPECLRIINPMSDPAAKLNDLMTAVFCYPPIDVALTHLLNSPKKRDWDELSKNTTGDPRQMRSLGMLNDHSGPPCVEDDYMRGLVLPREMAEAGVPQATGDITDGNIGDACAAMNAAIVRHLIGMRVIMMTGGNAGTVMAHMDENILTDPANCRLTAFQPGLVLLKDHDWEVIDEFYQQGAATEKVLDIMRSPQLAEFRRQAEIIAREASLDNSNQLIAFANDDQNPENPAYDRMQAFYSATSWSRACSDLYLWAFRRAVYEIAGDRASCQRLDAERRAILGRLQHIQDVHKELFGDNVPDLELQAWAVDWPRLADILVENYRYILAHVSFKTVAALPGPTAPGPGMPGPGARPLIPGRTPPSFPPGVGGPGMPTPPGGHTPLPGGGSDPFRSCLERLLVQTATLRDELLAQLDEYESYVLRETTAAGEGYDALRNDITSDLTVTVEELETSIGGSLAATGRLDRHSQDSITAAETAHNTIIDKTRKEFADRIEALVRRQYGGEKAPKAERDRIEYAARALAGRFNRLETFGNFWEQAPRRAQVFADTADNQNDIRITIQHIERSSALAASADDVTRFIRDPQVLLDAVRQHHMSPRLGDLLTYPQVRDSGWTPRWSTGFSLCLRRQ